MAATAPSWADLDRDLLHLIMRSPCLDPLDLMSCRKVCVSWRWVSKKVCANIHRSPVLHLMSCFFYPNLNINGFYPILLPRETRDQWHFKFMHSCRGWLLCSQGHRLELVNPFSLARINLPRCDFDKPGSNLVLSGSPSDPGCQILLLDLNHRRVRRLNRRRDGWTNVYSYMQRNFDDVIIYRGRFLTVDEDGSLKDLKCNRSSKPPVAYTHPKTRRRYLVESLSGDLLMVTRSVRWKRRPIAEEDFVVTMEFGVEKIVLSDWNDPHSTSSGSSTTPTVASFEEVTSLGDDEAIFLAFGDSRCIKVFGPTQPNCIYFADYSMLGYHHILESNDSGVFNMENKTIQNIPGDPFCRWFKPDI
ncbi:hypothetical protein Tsubulata_018809 [Turnera subulata]|uniref:KIB1-4 beta-propeller domain-containing protein n=1 Tax=Turnera subulata TaxID=218843 RepID=A0A9Q0J3Y5_9ROSI|nr:hypothetical protein Tsubulata_018809 [Turnera subulata]